MLKLLRFNSLLEMLKEQLFVEKIIKKVEVLKIAELLLKGQNLIYSGFVDNIFDHDNIHQFGKEEAFCDDYNDEAMNTSAFDHKAIETSNFDHDDKSYTPEGTSRDMPDLESEESAERRRNQQGQGLKIPTPKKCLVDYQFL